MVRSAPSPSSSWPFANRLWPVSLSRSLNRLCPPALDGVKRRILGMIGGLMVGLTSEHRSNGNDAVTPFDSFNHCRERSRFNVS